MHDILVAFFDKKGVFGYFVPFPGVHAQDFKLMTTEGYVIENVETEDLYKVVATIRLHDGTVAVGVLPTESVPDEEQKYLQ